MAINPEDFFSTQPPVAKPAEPMEPQIQELTPEQFFGRATGQDDPERGMALLKGLGSSSAGLVKTVGMALAAPAILVDKVKSLPRRTESGWTSNLTTEAQDFTFKNIVQPWQDREDDLAPEGDDTSQGLWVLGKTIGFLNQAILSSGAAAPLAAAGTTLPATATNAARVIEALRQSTLQGVSAVQLPAVNTAIEIGLKVQKETGDTNQALNAAQMHYLNMLAMAAPPAGAQGPFLLRTLGAGVASVAQGEAMRHSMNQVLPESMQHEFAPLYAAMDFFLGAGLGAGVGRDFSPAKLSEAIRADDAAWNELMATKPGAADAAVKAVEGVDPKQAAELKKRVAAMRKKGFVLPDDEALGIGERAAKAEVAKPRSADEMLNDLKPPPDGGDGGGPPQPVSPAAREGEDGRVTSSVSGGQVRPATELMNKLWALDSEGRAPAGWKEKAALIFRVTKDPAERSRRLMKLLNAEGDQELRLREQQDRYLNTSDGMARTVSRIHDDTERPPTRGAPEDVDDAVAKSMYDLEMKDRRLRSWDVKLRSARGGSGLDLKRAPVKRALAVRDLTRATRTYFNGLIAESESRGLYSATDTTHPIEGSPHFADSIAISMAMYAREAGHVGLANMIRALAPLLKGVEVEFVHPQHMVMEGLPAHYEPNRGDNKRAPGTIRLAVARRGPFHIGDSDSNVAKNFLHEMIHAITSDFIWHNASHPLVKELRGMLAEAKKRARRMSKEDLVDNTVMWGDYLPSSQMKNVYARLYGMTNIDEFLAEAFSNAQFQRFLIESENFASPTWKAKSMVGQWTDTIKRILVGAARGKVDWAKVKPGLLDDVLVQTDVLARESSRWRRNNDNAQGPTMPDMGASKETQVAFEKLVNKARSTTPVKVAEGKLKVFWDEIRETFSPESFGPKAKVAGAMLAKQVATVAQKHSMLHGHAAARKAFWERVPANIKAEFISRFEKGETFNDPTLQKVADGYRAWNERIYQQDKSLGLTYEPLDNYLYHVFAEGDKVNAHMRAKYGNKWGDPGFIKDRSFSLYEEAVAAGFTPKYRNPEEIMLARQHASDIAMSRIEALRELASNGLAVPVKKGSTAPDGHSPLPRRSPNGELYWVHEDANRIMHNLYDTRGLWGDQGTVGSVFRGLMYAKNTLVPIQLGLSAFHGIHVGTIDNWTALVRSTKLLAGGQKNAAEWLLDLGKAVAFLDARSNYRYGRKYLDILKGQVPESAITEADRVGLKMMAEGGLIPTMDPKYLTHARHEFMTAVREHSAMAIWKAPFALVDTIQYPMFEIWIPSLKINSYLKDVETALRIDPSLMNDQTRRQIVLRKLSKSIDNRYGEMAYNTLFWKRWVKDIGVGSSLSLGWNLGFLREYGGAMIDLGQAATTQRGPFQQKLANADYDRAIFVSLYTLGSLAYGGLFTYLMSGELPETLRDYVLPKNGEKNPDGTDQRVSTMFYAKEFAAISKHMEHQGVLKGLGQTVVNKMSPAISMVKEWTTGVNYFGEEIRDPNAPAYKQLMQTIVSTMGNTTPISVGQIIQNSDIGQSQKPIGERIAGNLAWMAENPGKVAIAVAGVTKAPKYQMETSTQGAIKNEFQKYYGRPRKPFERAEYSEESRELRTLYESKDVAGFNTLLLQMVKKHELTRQEKNRLVKSIKDGEDPYIRMFSRLTWERQKVLLDEMTPEERKVYLPRSNKDKLRRKYKPPEE